jgi:hypothetical protein
MHAYNNTDRVYSYGWVNNSYIILKTDVTEYSVVLSSPDDRIGRGESPPKTVEFSDVRGNIVEIELRGLMPLGDSGLPIHVQGGVYETLDPFIFTIDPDRLTVIPAQSRTPSPTPPSSPTQAKTLTPTVTPTPLPEPYPARSSPPTPAPVLFTILPIVIMILACCGLTLAVCFFISNRNVKACAEAVIDQPTEENVKRLTDALRRSVFIAINVDIVAALFHTRLLLENTYTEIRKCKKISPDVAESLRKEMLKRGCRLH